MLGFSKIQRMHRLIDVYQLKSPMITVKVSTKTKMCLYRKLEPIFQNTGPGHMQRLVVPFWRVVSYSGQECDQKGRVHQQIINQIWDAL